MNKIKINIEKLKLSLENEIRVCKIAGIERRIIEAKKRLELITGIENELKSYKKI